MYIRGVWKKESEGIKILYTDFEVASVVLLELQPHIPFLVGRDTHPHFTPFIVSPHLLDAATPLVTSSCVETFTNLCVCVCVCVSVRTEASRELAWRHCSEHSSSNATAAASHVTAADFRCQRHQRVNRNALNDRTSRDRSLFDSDGHICRK